MACVDVLLRAWLLNSHIGRGRCRGAHRRLCSKSSTALLFSLGYCVWHVARQGPCLSLPACVPVCPSAPLSACLPRKRRRSWPPLWMHVHASAARPTCDAGVRSHAMSCRCVQVSRCMDMHCMTCSGLLQPGALRWCAIPSCVTCRTGLTPCVRPLRVHHAPQSRAVSRWWCVCATCRRALAAQLSEGLSCASVEGWCGQPLSRARLHTMPLSCRNASIHPTLAFHACIHPTLAFHVCIHPTFAFLKRIAILRFVSLSPSDMCVCVCVRMCACVCVFTGKSRFLRSSSTVSRCRATACNRLQPLVCAGSRSQQVTIPIPVKQSCNQNN